MAQRLHLDHAAVHVAALKTYLQHYCQDLWFGNPALGAVRARDWTTLLRMAKQVDEALTCQDLPGLGPLTEVSSGLAIDSFRRSYQFVALVTKYPYDATQIPGLDPDRAGIDGFLRAETRSRRLNTILRAYRVRSKDRHPAWKIMRNWIRKVMGETPNMDQILPLCDFSSGASLGVHGKATHFGNKVVKGNTVTPTALKYFTSAVLRNEQLHAFYSQEASDGLRGGTPIEKPVCLLTPTDLLRYFNGTVNLVQYDKLSCVPKKFDKSRLVGTPATLNTFVQKGTDQFMRARLKERGGIDLSRQDVNQYMAWEGSVEEALDPYVTEDIKDASNSVLIEVVRNLYSEEWFTFLNDTRSPGYESKKYGLKGRFELFVSMGNGFCFPLETSIFAAACVAACKLCKQPVDFRVYGDDIIVRQSVALMLREILRSFGFRTNVDKSYVFGPFRESCGANWYRGRDVTPVFWRKRVMDRRELHAIHNAFYEYPKVQETLREFDISLPYCVPDWPSYHWVVDQAFRVTQDVCMAHGAVWRRDTQSHRYPMLITQPVADSEIPAENRWHRLRHISALRGSTFEDAFLLRRTTKATSSLPKAEGLECEISRTPLFKQKRRIERVKQSTFDPSPEEAKAIADWYFQPPQERQFPWIEAVLRSCLRDVQQEKSLRRNS